MNDILNFFHDAWNPGELLNTIENMQVTAIQYVKFLAILIFGVLFLSSVARFLFGKKAQLNLAFTSSMEILCVYVITILIHALGWQLQQFVTPLPFVNISGDYLILYPILNAEFTNICSHILKLLIIAFLVNMINEFIPKGEHLITWLLLRMITIVISIAVIYVLELALNTFLPEGLQDIAPTVLLCALIALILLGALRWVVGAVLVFLDPISAALYTFFFSTFIGRALARAMVSTALLTGLIVALHYLEISVVLIAATVLTAYIPLLLIALVLWYIVGHIL